MKPLVVIPARGGSKGIPGKNRKLLNGTALINYTVQAARKVFDDTNIFVSTDDIKIKRVVEKAGLVVPFLRPAELATDTSSTYEVLLHALEYSRSMGLNPDIIVLLQPTSPFRTSIQIKEALKNYEKDIDMVVSVKETSSNPYYVLFEEDNKGFLKKSKEANFIRRQDCPKVWEYNGAIYVINVNSLLKENFLAFKKVRKLVMDEMTSLDVDTELDWLVAEHLMKAKK